MTKSPRRAVHFALVVLATASGAIRGADAVAAQEFTPPTRSGFWFSGGFGGGWNASQGLDGERLWGRATYIRVGGTLSPHFRMAGEIAAWSDEVETDEFDGDDRLLRGTLLASLSYYPWIERGFVLRGGLGLASVDTPAPRRLPEFGDLGVGMETVTGFGSALGIGYDIPVGTTLMVTPNVDWYFQAFDAPPGLPGTNHVLQFTFGVTTY
ncbi:MAG: hypothetical protein RQ751_05935 [Longimicrobiales bacterium]|nr:hypothetical protein [Longimicrobiales bacterium]